MFTTRPTLQGTHGMVSSTHWLASQSAMAVLEDGGNAYDAVVAGAFVLHVVEPHLNGPAGEVPILLAPAGGQVRVLCGQGVAPAGASVAHYRGLGLDLVPGTGPLAAAVPGAFDAWMVLLRDHGTRSLDDVLKYAVGYAEHGHAPVENLGATVETVRELFETEWTSSAELYLPGGRAPGPDNCCATPPLPPPGAGCSPRPRAPGTARRASRPRGRCGGPGSSPRHWSARPGGPPSTPAAPGTPARSPPTTSPPGPRPTRRRRRTTGTAGPCARPGPGARGPRSCSNWRCCRASCPSAAARTTSTCWSRAASSPWPTGRPGTATRRRCRWPSCCRGSTTPGGGPWSAPGRRWSCGPAAPAGGRPG